ncbi:sugar ABC transporter ATP-binding protein [Streptomyces wedmorensis]
MTVPEAAEDAYLVCDHITKCYGDTTALDQVSLIVRRSRVHALVGRNGAGKSTLAKVILGTVRPDQGELRFDGRRAVFRSPRHALRAGIGGVSQEPALVPALTVLQNVFLGSEPFFWGRSRAALKHRYAALAERVGWPIAPDRKVADLGIAERQKVEVLRCLARDAHLIVFDEPTASLNPAESRALLDVVRTLQEQGTTIIYITHLLDEVIEVADIVSVLNDGDIVCTQPTAGLTTDALAVALTGPQPTSETPAFSSVRPGSQYAATPRTRGLSSPVALRVSGFPDSALGGLVLNVRKGEILGLISDSAHTTESLARSLNGRGADTAFVTIDGALITSPYQAVHAGIVLLPSDRERDATLRNQSLAANVTLLSLGQISRFGFIGRGKERTASRHLCQVLGITALAAAPIESLSGGTRQKVMIARCLMQLPRVLVADHPTHGLDRNSRHTVHELLRHAADAGTAIMLISDSIDELLATADRLVVLRGGKITRTYSRPDRIGRLEVITAVFGDDRITGSTER